MRPCHLFSRPLLLVRGNIPPLLARNFLTVRCLCFFSERFILFKQGYSHFIPGDLASSVTTSLSGASTPMSVLLGRESGKDLHLLLSEVLACPATVSSCFTLSLGCLHSCSLAPNLSARRFSLCVSTPSQFPLPLQASGLLYADESPLLRGGQA